MAFRFRESFVTSGVGMVRNGAAGQTCILAICKKKITHHPRSLPYIKKEIQVVFRMTNSKHPDFLIWLIDSLDTSCSGKHVCKWSFFFSLNFLLVFSGNVTERHLPPSNHRSRKKIQKSLHWRVFFSIVCLRAPNQSRDTSGFLLPGNRPPGFPLNGNHSTDSDNFRFQARGENNSTTSCVLLYCVWGLEKSPWE